MHNDILLVSGTRPEIIKLAPVYHALAAAPWARVTWLHTGQHAEMAQQTLDSFHIVPGIELERPGSNLLDFSLACRRQLDAVMTRQAWSLVIVQGDTESAFQGALAAFYNQRPLAHVEAGLRTHDLGRPFPEEGVRQMISRLARFQFAPTVRARSALRSEGIAEAAIHLSGNTVIDAQHWARRQHGIERRAKGRGHLLVTLHRRENWGHDLEEACRAIAVVATRHPELEVLFPVHLNQIVQAPVQAILGGSANVRLVAPLDYVAMQQALADAWLVLTDSGGLQEEAPTWGAPLLVVRKETERPEAIEAGCARLVGTERRAIVDEIERLWNDAGACQRMRVAINPFGDGRAAQRIVAVLADHFVAASERVAAAA